MRCILLNINTIIIWYNVTLSQFLVERVAKLSDVPPVKNAGAVATAESQSAFSGAPSCATHDLTTGRYVL
jgi:hypothetical protein